MVALEAAPEASSSTAGPGAPADAGLPPPHRLPRRSCSATTLHNVLEHEDEGLASAGSHPDGGIPSASHQPEPPAPAGRDSLAAAAPMDSDRGQERPGSSGSSSAAKRVGFAADAGAAAEAATTEPAPPEPAAGHRATVSPFERVALNPFTAADGSAILSESRAGARLASWSCLLSTWSSLTPCWCKIHLLTRPEPKATVDNTIQGLRVILCICTGSRGPSSTGDDTCCRHSADGGPLRAKSASAPFISSRITTGSFLENTVIRPCLPKLQFSYVCLSGPSLLEDSNFRSTEALCEQVVQCSTRPLRECPGHELLVQQTPGRGGQEALGYRSLQPDSAEEFSLTQHRSHVQENVQQMSGRGLRDMVS